ncbi:MAG: hypothetical protein GIW97_07650 [Candidatus Eremiobacteraeota bacterium]|nr:hypothetical protein [Candidatus Eremiobacteraeota bacterium]
MTQRVRGTVINVHMFGATVRLENGEMASVPIGDVNANRATYTRALSAKTDLPFDAHPGTRHKILVLAKTRIDEPIDPSSAPPEITDEHLEGQIASYLKETQEWEAEDAPAAHERHFLRKKRRAAFFESRHSKDR